MTKACSRERDHVYERPVWPALTVLDACNNK